jgi:hypothetical protein
MTDGYNDDDDDDDGLTIQNASAIVTLSLFSFMT